MEAQIIEQRIFGSALRWITLAAPALASAQPGQFIMLRCTDATSNDPFLRRPFFIADADPSAGTIGLFYVVTGSGTRWLSHLASGATINLLGPLGRPLRVDGRMYNLLLVAEDWAVAPLLFLARRSSSTILLLHKASTPNLRMPPFLLPPDVEYLSVDEPLEALLSRPLSAGQTPPLQWSDLIIGAGGSELAQHLGAMLRMANRHEPTNQAQYIMINPLPCGIGLCGGCSMKTQRAKARQRLLCVEGPAQNLETSV